MAAGDAPPRPLRLVVAWLASAVALLLAAGIVPGAEVRGFGGAVLVAALVAIVNAVIPPVLAALRLPFTAGLGFLLVLAADAAVLLIAADAPPQHLYVDGFGLALLVSLLAAAVSMAAGAIAGIDDDATTPTRRQARRAAHRAADRHRRPGLVFLEIDGLGLPILRRAIRDGTTPVMARWLEEGTHALASGRPTSPRRPAPARRGSCSATTTTSRRSAGSTRRAARS